MCSPTKKKPLTPKKRGIAHFCKPRSPVKMTPVMASVVVDKPVKGMILTETREMRQCPKSDLARTRVVAVNTGPRHISSGKNMSQIRALIHIRTTDPQTKGVSYNKYANSYSDS